MSDPVAEIFRQAKTIAVVGLSDDESRPSYEVAAYLESQGYEIIPVNPRLSEALGAVCYPDLHAVPNPSTSSMSSGARSTSFRSHGLRSRSGPRRSGCRTGLSTRRPRKSPGRRGSPSSWAIACFGGTPR